MNQVSGVPQASAFTDPPPPAKIFVVSLLNGETWQLGNFVPGSENAMTPDEKGVDMPGTEGHEALRIVNLVQEEDGGPVRAFAVPVHGSKLDAQKTGAIFTLYPMTISRVMTLARGDLFMMMQRELADAAIASIVSKWTDIPSDMILELLEDAREELEDPDPDPEIEDPEAPPVTSPPALPPNGSPTTGGVTS